MRGSIFDILTKTNYTYISVRDRFVPDISNAPDSPLPRSWTTGNANPISESDAPRWFGVWPTFSRLMDDPLFGANGGKAPHIFNLLFMSDMMGTDYTKSVDDLYESIINQPRIQLTLGDFVKDATGMSSADLARWTNNTTRLDWKRLGLVCQMERILDRTYSYPQDGEMYAQLPVKVVEDHIERSFCVTNEATFVITNVSPGMADATLVNSIREIDWGEPRELYVTNRSTEALLSFPFVRVEPVVETSTLGHIQEDNPLCIKDETVTDSALAAANAFLETGRHVLPSPGLYNVALYCTVTNDLLRTSQIGIVGTNDYYYGDFSTDMMNVRVDPGWSVGDEVTVERFVLTRSDSAATTVKHSVDDVQSAVAAIADNPLNQWLWESGVYSSIRLYAWGGIIASFNNYPAESANSMEWDRLSPLSNTVRKFRHFAWDYQDTVPVVAYSGVDAKRALVSVATNVYGEAVGTFRSLSGITNDMDGVAFELERAATNNAWAALAAQEKYAAGATYARLEVQNHLADRSVKITMVCDAGSSFRDPTDVSFEVNPGPGYEPLGHISGKGWIVASWGVSFGGDTVKVSHTNRTARVESEINIMPRIDWRFKNLGRP